MSNQCKVEKGEELTYPDIDAHQTLQSISAAQVPKKQTKPILSLPNEL
jgi:hypothetical protein